MLILHEFVMKGLYAIGMMKDQSIPYGEYYVSQAGFEAVLNRFSIESWLGTGSNPFLNLSITLR